jgi:hypothetical protein
MISAVRNLLLSLEWQCDNETIACVIVNSMYCVRTARAIMSWEILKNEQELKETRTLLRFCRISKYIHYSCTDYFIHLYVL